VNPGWYADPHGGPDLRWWDGSSWTEHTSPPVGPAPAAAAASSPAPSAASPAPATDPWAAPVGAPAGAPSGDQWAAPAAAPPQWGPPATQAPPGGPGGPGPVGFGAGGGFPPPQQAGGGSNRTLLVVLGIGVALLLVIGGVVLFSGGDDDTSTGTTTTTSTTEDVTTTSESDVTTTTAPDGTSELVTSGALSFTRLPSPWGDWASAGQNQIYELSNTAGQFVVVQENAPSGGQWIGNLLIGDLGPSIAYAGTADLPNAAQLLTNELVASYYVEGAAATTIQNTAVEIDGHPAHFIHTELSFSEAGLDTTNEKVVVVLIDTGASRPSVFWASIPYNRADLNDGMDQVYRTLVVND
jgi:Protein of unknown function (DUF2510)